jgi:Sugar (and other) transporter
MTHEECFVIFACSVGSIFEWYDFFVYAVLAPFLAAMFFPPGNETAALLSAFATYAAGFLVRPFGAIIFGRAGDLLGRKYTFLATIIVMGAATFLLGLLPTFATIGWAATVLLVALRLLQGLAVGGEYGGAVTYVAEHARAEQRGYATSFVQLAGTLAVTLALAVIMLCRGLMDAESFASWGWRLPFLVSVFLLVFSVYIRLRLGETPIFRKMKAEGKTSKAPLTESFLRYPNIKYVLLALFMAAAQSVLWYTAHFYALFFLTITLKLDYVSSDEIVLIALVIAAPTFVLFGWLSDRVGRLKIMLVGLAFAALTYFPLFSALTHYVNPGLEAFVQRTPITLTVNESSCTLHVFVGPWSRFSPCDRAKDFVSGLGLPFRSENAPAGMDAVELTIGSTKIDGFDRAGWNSAFLAAGYPDLAREDSGNVIARPADPANVNRSMAVLIIVILTTYAAMIYGPMAAFLAEMFPTRIRYTSLSVPYHVGVGWIGGMLPLLATALVAAYGNIYIGLWYPIGVAVVSAVIGAVFLRDTKGVDFADESGAATRL